MSAPENRQEAAKAVQMAQKGVKSGAKTQAKRLSSKCPKVAALQHLRIRVVQDILNVGF